MIYNFLLENLRQIDLIELLGQFLVARHKSDLFYNKVLSIITLIIRKKIIIIYC